MGSNGGGVMAAKWLRRIFSLEFVGVVVGVVAAYFGWVQVRSYFVDDEPVRVYFNGEEVKLGKSDEVCDTICVLAFTRDGAQLPAAGLLSFVNGSGNSVTGLNVEAEFVSCGLGAYWSRDWEYLCKREEYREEGQSLRYERVRNADRELPPGGELCFPFYAVSYSDYPGSRSEMQVQERWMDASFTVNYDGCKGARHIYFRMAVMLDQETVPGLHEKRYGESAIENRRGFDLEYTEFCQETVRSAMRENPEAMSGVYVLINRYDGPLVMKAEDVK